MRYTLNLYHKCICIYEREKNRLCVVSTLPSGRNPSLALMIPICEVVLIACENNTCTRGGMRNMRRTHSSRGTPANTFTGINPREQKYFSTACTHDTYVQYSPKKTQLIERAGKHSTYIMNQLGFMHVTACSNKDLKQSQISGTKQNNMNFGNWNMANWWDKVERNYRWTTNDNNTIQYHG